MSDTINTLCPLYNLKVFKTNVIYVGLEAKDKEYSNSEGKKESRAYDELLQIKWPKEVKPLLYFLIELIQNPNFLPD